jgi:hypothetical protein
MIFSPTTTSVLSVNLVEIKTGYSVEVFGEKLVLVVVVNARAGVAEDVIGFTTADRKKTATKAIHSSVQGGK